MKMMKRILLFIMVLSFMTMAFMPLQQDENPWRNVFVSFLGVVLALLGAPLTQWIKNALGVQDKLAVLLTGLVAVVLAFAEMFFSGLISGDAFTLEQFPATFTAIMTVATFYYHLLKDSDSVLGARGLLKVT